MRKDTKILKRKLRYEKKCKKLAALLEVSKLNHEDRLKKNGQSTTVIPDDESASKRICIESNTNSLNDTTVGKLRQTGAAGKPLLHGEEYLKLKQELKERRSALIVLPKFRLREIGQRATLDVEKEERIPLYFPDIQHLLLYSQIGHHSPYAPTRWCQLDKYNRLHHTNVLIVENVSLHHFQSYESCFTYLSEHFPYKLELITYQGDIVQDLVTVPLTGQQTKTIIAEYGSLQNAVVHSPDVFDRINGVFPSQQKVQTSGLPAQDKFSRTDLLLSGWQMVDENYPMPIKGLVERKYAAYVLTKDSYRAVTACSPMFSIDCEMCLTAVGSELTRVSVVDENCSIIYEELVKPISPIVNYLTRFSGITPKMLKNVTKRLTEVQEDLRRILPADAILVGQSLNNDLHALQIMHPYIIDTSIIYNVTGDRRRKTKLQTLAREFLNIHIQESQKGHCSIEDSKASMMLVKHKLKHDVTYGDAVSGNIATQINCYTALGNPNFGTSFLKRITKVEKTAQVVASEDVIVKYRHYTYKENEPTTSKINCIATENDTVVEKVCETAANYTFNAAHVFVTDDDLNKDGRSICTKINKWVEDLHKSSKKPELFVVVFAGHREFGNGCCFISMKNCRR